MTGVARINTLVCHALQGLQARTGLKLGLFCCHLLNFRHQDFGSSWPGLGIPRKQLALDQVAGGEVAAQKSALVQAQASLPRLESRRASLIKADKRVVFRERPRD